MAFSARKIGRRFVRRLRRLSGAGAGPTILMYHRIAEPAYDPWGLAASPANFDIQMAWLKRHRLVLPLAEFEALRLKGSLPRNAVAVTFDDGYACNKLVAEPILAAHEAPATIFLTTGAISSPEEFWWDELERITSNAAVDRLAFDIGGHGVEIHFGSTAGKEREDAYTTLWRGLRPLDADTRKATLAHLAERCGVPAAARDEYRAMTESELAEMARSPWVTFGAHSISHPALSGLARAEARREIESSRDACARLTGARPTMFAYPYGDYSEETVELVEAAGFALAVTTDAGVVGPETASLRLPRIQVGDWDEAELAKALAVAA